MGKTVALVYPTHGHLTPSLAVAEALVRRGEEVVCYATPRARAQVERSGARFRAYGPDDAAFNPDPPTEGLFADMARLLALTEETLPSLIAEVRAEAPDYLLIDTKSVWGRLVAQALDLPAITLSVVFALTRGHVPVSDLVRMLCGGAPAEALLRGLQALGAYADTARRLAARHGVTAPDVIDFLANPQPLTIVFTSREFQIRTDTFGDAYRFVGVALSRDRGGERDGDRDGGGHREPRPGEPPLVYVSLGTTFNDAPAFYQSCFEAFAGQPWRVVLSTGGRAMRLPDAPPNVDVQAFVPQLDVLRRAQAFVTHGGMNSANEGLLHGVPMVVVPQRGDQHLVAARIAELGAGLAVSPSDATAIRLRESVARVLGEGAFRERARSLGRSLDAAGGAARAADEILAAIGDRRRARADVARAAPAQEASYR